MRESFRNSNYLDEQQHERQEYDEVFQSFVENEIFIALYTYNTLIPSFYLRILGSIVNVHYASFGINSLKDFHSIVMDFHDDNFPSLHYS